jgi:hypothetical protein
LIITPLLPFRAPFFAPVNGADDAAAIAAKTPTSAT